MKANEGKKESKVGFNLLFIFDVILEGKSLILRIFLFLTFFPFLRDFSLVLISQTQDSILALDFSL